MEAAKYECRGNARDNFHDASIGHPSRMEPRGNAREMLEDASIGHPSRMEVTENLGALASRFHESAENPGAGASGGVSGKITTSANWHVYGKAHRGQGGGQPSRKQRLGWEGATTANKLARITYPPCPAGCTEEMSAAAMEDVPSRKEAFKQLVTLISDRRATTDTQGGNREPSVSRKAKEHHGESREQSVYGKAKGRQSERLQEPPAKRSRTTSGGGRGDWLNPIKQQLTTGGPLARRPPVWSMVTLMRLLCRGTTGWMMMPPVTMMR